MSALGVEVDVRHVLPGEQKTGGRRRLGGDRVTGELVEDKLVVGQVGIEGSDQPVAIAPRVGANLVMLETVGLGEPREVEPVLRPAFAVGRGGQQRVEQPLVRVRPRIGLEGGDRLCTRRQAKQVEMESADQRPSIGLRRLAKPVWLQPCGDEMVDGIGQLPGLWHLRNCRLAKRLPCPVGAILRGDGWLDDGVLLLRLAKCLAKRQPGQQGDGAEAPHHAKISVTTRPPTSVRRSSRPL